MFSQFVFQFVFGEVVACCLNCLLLFAQGAFVYTVPKKICLSYVVFGRSLLGAHLFVYFSAVHSVFIVCSGNIRLLCKLL